MRDQQALPARGGVLGLRANLDAAESKAQELACRLIVVARDVGDLRALA